MRCGDLSGMDFQGVGIQSGGIKFHQNSVVGIRSSSKIGDLGRFLGVLSVILLLLVQTL